jgi:hypothetical protein
LKKFSLTWVRHGVITHRSIVQELIDLLSVKYKVSHDPSAFEEIQLQIWLLLVGQKAAKDGVQHPIE